MSKNTNLDQSNAFYTESGLDRETWFSISEIDYRKLIETIDFSSLFDQENINILLDVGCGTGKLPQMISKYMMQASNIERRITYDYLDPSEYSLQTLAQNLSAPFQKGTAFQTTLEEMTGKQTAAYDLIWAMHSLYVLDKETLNIAITNFMSMVKNDGIALIYHAAEESFYHSFYNAYLADFDKSNRAPYITAEEVAQHLPANHHKQTIKTEHFARGDAQKALEYYLQQLCFDEEIYLDDFLNANRTGALLDKHKSSDGNYYFPQTLHIMSNRAF